MSRPALRLRVEVNARPEPTLLQRAIASRLAGQSWAGAERAVADAVADAVAAARAERKQPWR
jgi:hypothetical protein